MIVGLPTVLLAVTKPYRNVHFPRYIRNSIKQIKKNEGLVSNYIAYIAAKLCMKLTFI